ncbi:hypothetical protein [Halorubrum sp. AJ67]|uniref:hypothetical protein n=1 Tax=Halorubrum sp. AJ67 TaxID=1173487 RepID=UPI0003DD2A63|nr:hypothetical protein [Halorubrum sp. AJ67]CDK38163.1 hypothetical protein BN903_363 [Halorubrum sp. AJ67]
MHLHEHDDTHLWEGPFAALAAGQIDAATDDVLILAEDESEVRRLHSDIVTELGTPIAHAETYAGAQEELPFDVDTFDVSVQVNPSRSPFKRHQPLYQASAVTRPNGTIVYKAPRSLAHSEAVEIDTIYALNWKHHETPSLAALMTVSLAGTLGETNPTATASPSRPSHEQPPETEETTITSFT